MLGVILAITVGMGPYLEKLIGEGDAASGVGLVVGMLLVLATVVRLGGGFAGWEYEVGQDGADRKILKPFMASYFNAVTKWDRVLNPSTFHEKWLLRSYFSLMQAESVLTSEPLDARPRLNYTHLHTSDFARATLHELCTMPTTTLFMQREGITPFSCTPTRHIPDTSTE